MIFKTMSLVVYGHLLGEYDHYGISLITTYFGHPSAASCRDRIFFSSCYETAELCWWNPMHMEIRWRNKTDEFTNTRPEQ